MCVFHAHAPGMLAGILDVRLKKTTKGGSSTRGGGADSSDRGSSSTGGAGGGSPRTAAKGNRAARSEALAAARAIPTDVKQAIEDAQVS